MTGYTFKSGCLSYDGKYHLLYVQDMNDCLCQDQGYSTDLLDPTQVESKNTFSQIQWPVPSINAESVDIFLGEE